MKAKKLIALALTTAMLGSVFTGCSKGGGSDEGNADSENKSSGGEQVELNYIFADGDEGAKVTMNKVVEDFNESHPDIKVNIVPGNGSTYSEFLKTKDSVGEFPDVMEMRDTAMYVRAGKLAELPEDITSLFLNTQEFDGKVYTAPMSGENTQGIIYNKKY